MTCPTGANDLGVLTPVDSNVAGGVVLDRIG